MEIKVSWIGRGGEIRTKWSELTGRSVSIWVTNSIENVK